jgi:hypothetical protein
VVLVNVDKMETQPIKKKEEYDWAFNHYFDTSWYFPTPGSKDKIYNAPPPEMSIRISGVCGTIESEIW